MNRRTARLICLALGLTCVSCDRNAGNGEAQPENTKQGYNADNEKKDQRQGGLGQGKATTPSNPGPAQTPSDPASKPDGPH